MISFYRLEFIRFYRINRLYVNAIAGKNKRTWQFHQMNDANWTELTFELSERGRART